MSKYLLVVDLPDDDRCRGCPLLNEVQDWCFATEAHIDLIEWGNPMNWIRNLDCPLIPVDRVIGSVFHLDASVQYGVSTDDVASALRDEFGVTE